MPPIRTLVDLLQRQAQRHEDTIALTFSHNGDDERCQLTYRELDTKARGIGSRLQQQGAAGQRVLVFCRPGLDGVVGLFGCLYAGAIAVPIHRRLAPKLRSIVSDAQAGFALAASSTQAYIRSAVDVRCGGLPLRWFALDEVTSDVGSWVPPDLDADTIAMIQYVSGSCLPNSVALTHRNLIDNLLTIHQAWRGDEHEIAAYWLADYRCIRQT